MCRRCRGFVEVTASTTDWQSQALRPLANHRPGRVAQHPLQPAGHAHRLEPPEKGSCRSRARQRLARRAPAYLLSSPDFGCRSPSGCRLNETSHDDEVRGCKLQGSPAKANPTCSGIVTDLDCWARGCCRWSSKRAISILAFQPFGVDAQTQAY